MFWQSRQWWYNMKERNEQVAVLLFFSFFSASSGSIIIIIIRGVLAIVLGLSFVYHTSTLFLYHNSHHHHHQATHDQSLCKSYSKMLVGVIVGRSSTICTICNAYYFLSQSFGFVGRRTPSLVTIPQNFSIPNFGGASACVRNGLA